MTGVVPTRPNLAPRIKSLGWRPTCSPPSRPRRAATGGGLRPVLTAAVRDATLSPGRDEETAPPAEQTNCARNQTFLQNFPDATHVRSVCEPCSWLRLGVPGGRPSYSDSTK